MKTILLISILMTIQISCSEGDSNKTSFCDNEIQLLERATASTVNFDFSLTHENQFDSIQNQLPFNICNHLYELNAKFPFAPGDTLEAVLIVERICEEDLSTLELSRRSREPIQILINKCSKILMDDHSIDIDSLGKEVTVLTKSHFGNKKLENRDLAFQLRWDEGTPVPFRKKAFKLVVDGYLGALSDFAKLAYKRGICELEDSEIKELKRKYEVTFVLRDNLPPPKFPEIVPDIIEREIEEEI